MDVLNKIQHSLKAPKGQYNKFGNYKYRSCEDILEAVKPMLGTATLLLSDELMLIGDRYYIKATATLTEGDKSISSTAYAREEETKKGMDASQITGSASSYARKYALNGLFLTDDTKDADTMDNQEETKTTKPLASPPPESDIGFFDEPPQPEQEPQLTKSQQALCKWIRDKLKSMKVSVPYDDYVADMLEMDKGITIEGLTDEKRNEAKKMLLSDKAA